MNTDKFGLGKRVGHFGLSGAKSFSPEVSNKTYFYHKGLVPSIESYERIGQDAGPSMDNMSPSQIINTVAGDGGYYNDLLRHYDRIPSEYWKNAGLSYNRKLAEAFGNMRLPVYPNAGKEAMLVHGRMVPLISGRVENRFNMQAPRNAIVGINRTHEDMRNRLKFLGDYNFKGSNSDVDSASMYTMTGSDQPLSANKGSTLHHEALHSSVFPGNTKRVFIGGNVYPARYISTITRGNDPVLTRINAAHNYDPFSSHRSFIAGKLTPGRLLRDMRTVKNANKYALSRAEYDKAGFTPYDLNEIELMRGVSSYNQNRNNLARNIKRNKLQYMLAGFDPWKLTWATMQPKFYSHDNAGRDRFIADMEFYRKNPEMAELLGVEGRRVIPSYHNMTKVLESKDPKNKELQNKVRHIRDRFINYRILGNRSNSTVVPSNVTYPRSNSRTTVG